MASKKTSSKAAKKTVAKKKVPAKKTSKKAEEEAPKTRGRKKVKEDGSPEGMTVETQETGVITFKAGSGSQDLNILIAKHGFNREAVLDEAAELQDEGKMFKKADPAKKYSKVAGLIKSLQKEENGGNKLMTAKAAQKLIDALEADEDAAPAPKKTTKKKAAAKKKVAKKTSKKAKKVEEEEEED